MPSRHQKCTCTNCATIFRMAQSNIDRAMRRGGMVCPVCVGEVVQGDVVLTPEQRRQIADLCAREAEMAAIPLNGAELARRAEMFAERRRVHFASIGRPVHTSKD